MAKNDSPESSKGENAPETSNEVENTSAENLPEVEKQGTVVLLANRASVKFKESLLRQAAEDTTSDSSEVMMQQLDSMLPREDLEEILDSDMGGTYETRDLIGMDIEIMPGIRVAESWEQFNAPLGVYVQFRAIALMDKPELGIGAGSELTVSSGAPLVVGKVKTLEANDFLPIKLRVAGYTARNGTVIKLVKIPGEVYTTK